MPSCSSFPQSLAAGPIPASEDQLPQLCAVIESIGKPDFDASLFDLYGAVLGISSYVVFCEPQDGNCHAVLRFGKKPMGDQGAQNRSEYSPTSVDGEYVRIPPHGTPLAESLNPEEQEHPEDNWVWSPQGVVNMHLPDRWGEVQFE